MKLKKIKWSQTRPYGPHDSCAPDRLFEARTPLGTCFVWENGSMGGPGITTRCHEKAPHEAMEEAERLFYEHAAKVISELTFVYEVQGER